MRQVIIDKRYKTLKKLGAGAMGVVYKVRDLKDNKTIALKMLSKERTSSEAVKRFKREFKLLAGLHHPNLCSVYDFGMLKDGRGYFTMECIEGKDIYRAAQGLLHKRIYPWVVQLSQVLEYIHSKGLIHYDIKPSNVLIAEGMEQRAESKKHYAKSPMPCVKLMDFGLTGEQRINGGELIKGTFPYIAPEVIEGLAVDQRADLYSLGVLLFETFARKPFREEDKDSFATLLKQRVKRSSAVPSKGSSKIPGKLERVILRLLAFEPSERFSRANEIIMEINKFVDSKFALETEKTVEGYLLSSRFVGREREMDTLKSLYEGVLQGKGKVVLIVGEAGIGKSRLLNEFRIFAQLRRSHCFTGHARKDKTEPLQPFYDIFSELINYMNGSDQSRSREFKFSLAVLFKIFPNLTNGHLSKNLPKLAPLGSEQEKLRTFEALSELIKHTTTDFGELVILLEDLHWADDLSIQFLEYLGRNLEDRNILICGSIRKTEITRNAVIKKIVKRLCNEGHLSRIELKPLKFRSLYSLLDSTITPKSNSSELVRYLMEKTGGNPFSVEEIMRMLLLRRGVSIGKKIVIGDFKQVSIPESIEDLVLRRLEDLSNDSKRVLKFGAVLLKGFSYDFMKRLTELKDTELSKSLWDLKRKQILFEKGNSYLFYHSTLSDVVSKRLDYQEKRNLNYQIGRTLEKVNRKNPKRVAEDLAYYFINAKDRRKGVSYGLLAARKSSERFANEQAIRFYRGVLGLLNDKNQKLRFDILQKLAKVEDHIGYYDDAIKDYNRALKMKIGAVEKRIRLYLCIGNVYERGGNYNNALPIFRRGSRLIKEMKPGRLKDLLQANVNVKICSTYQRTGHYDRADKFNFDSLRSLKGLKGKEALGWMGSIYSSLGVMESHKVDYGKGDYDKAISYYKKASTYYKRMGSEDRIAAVLNNTGISYFVKFEFQKSFDCYEKAIRISEKTGNQFGMAILLNNLGVGYNDKGYYLKALNCYQRALSISRKIGNPSLTGTALWGIGESFLRMCDYEKVKEYCEKALRIHDSIDYKEKMTYPIETIGNLHKTEGDYDLALKSYRRAVRIYRDIGHQISRQPLFVKISSTYIEIGRFSIAERYVKKALKTATRLNSKELKTECYLVLCQMNIMIKDYHLARDYCREGIIKAEELMMRRQLLQFLILLSEIDYREEKYIKGIRVANKAVKLAKEIGTRDLYADALLRKVKNEIKKGNLAKTEVFRNLDKVKKVAEEIDCPEIRWKIYFEYGRFLQDKKDYLKALGYYKKCIRIFMDVSNKIKNEVHRKSYLNRPDRQEVYSSVNEIERLA